MISLSQHACGAYTHQCADAQLTSIQFTRGNNEAPTQCGELRLGHLKKDIGVSTSGVDLEHHSRDMMMLSTQFELLEMGI